MQENDAKKNRAGKRYDEEKQQCELKDKQIAGHLKDLDDQSRKKAGLHAQVAQSAFQAVCQCLCCDISAMLLYFVFCCVPV